MQRMATSRPSSHAVALHRRVDAEAAELGLGGRLARAELDPAVRDQVEHGDPLGGPGRVVVGRGGLDDPVAEADPLVRWLAAARKTSGALECEYSSRKWCSTSQRYWIPEPVGQLDLVERVGDQPAARCRRPRAGAAGARRRSRTSSVAAGPPSGRSPLGVDQARRRAARTTEPRASISSSRSSASGRPSSARLDLAHAPARGCSPAPEHDRVARRRGPRARPIISAPGCRGARLADPGPVPHLGERRPQPVDVGRLVGADVADDPGGLPVAGDEVGVAQDRLGPAEPVEGRDLDEEEADHPADEHLERRGRCRRGGTRARAASAAPTISSVVRVPAAMPIRASIRAVWSSVTGSSKAMSRATNHMRLWPASLAVARPRRGRGPRRARRRCGRSPSR